MTSIRFKILLSIILCGTLFSAPTSVGDTTSGKVLSLGINISEIETDFVCRYVSDSGQYAVWTPYEKIPTYSFFNGRPAYMSSRLYVFSEKGFYFYNAQQMAWEQKDSRSFGKTAWAPITPPQVYVSNGRGISIFKNTGTLFGDMVIVESGETLSVYDLDFKPGSRDTFLYVGTSKGLFLGTGTDTSRTWERLGSLTDTLTTVVYDTLTGNVYAGGPLGFYLWDGSTIELKRPGRVNDISYADGLIYVSTPQGLYYSNDGGNTWNSAFGGIFDDLNVTVLLSLSDTMYVAVNDSGVFRLVSGTPTLLRDGLLPFRKIGGFKFLSLNVEAFASDEPSIFLGTEMGPFILQNDSWKLFAGWHTDPNNLLGMNVSTTMVDSMLVSLVPIFDSLKTFQKIKTHLQDSLGLNFPDEDQFDGIHIIVFPFYEVASDPTSGYYPDITPVFGYFNIGFYEDSLSTLKEAIHVEPLNYFTLGENAGDISIQKAFLNYLIHRVAFSATKPNERNYVITGMSLASAFFAGETSLSEGVLPDTWPLSPAYLTRFRENPNRSLTMISSTHPTTPEPAEIDREKLGLFFIYLLERYGWETFTTILSDTLHTGLSAIDSVLKAQGSSLNAFINEWVIANIVDDITNFPPYGYKNLDIQVSAEPFTETPAVESQTPYSGLYYVFEPQNTLTYPIRIEANDYAELSYYKVVYSDQNQVISIEPLSYDVSRNYYEGYSGTNKEVYISVSTNPTEFWIGTCMGDSIPPSPKFVVLQNPGVDNVLDFYVWDTVEVYTDIKESGAKMVVYSEGQDPDSGVSIPIDNLFSSGTYIIYYGNTTFTDQGAFNFSVWVQDIIGNDILTEPYSLTIFQFSSEGGSFVAFGGELAIEVPENAVTAPHMVLVNKISEEEMIKAGLLPEGMELGLSPVYLIGRRGFSMLKPVTITITHPSLKNEEASIFQYDPSIGWIPLEGNINRESGVGRVEITRLGWFQIRTFSGEKVEKVFLSLPTGNIFKGENLSIVYGLPTSTHVTLKVFNSSGQKVLTLVDKKTSPGIYEVNWDGHGERSRPLSQGVYFLRLDTQRGDKITQKFIILK